MNRRLKIILGVILLLLMLLLAGLLYLIIIFYFSEPGYISDTNTFLQEMKDKADIPAIRAWLNSMPAKDSSYYCFAEGTEWQDCVPECIKILSPIYVDIEAENMDSKIVRITWGGGFGHWGLVVGPEDMETPESDLKPPHGEYRVPLEAGAYVFHEIQ